MPVTVHKLQIHGVQVAEHRPLPIEAMSEEASEAANKFYQAVWEKHTRKANWDQTTQNLMSDMLVFSDPKLSTFRRSVQDRLTLPDEVLPLLVLNEEENLPLEELVSTTKW